MATATMDRAAWLAERRNSIGASEAAAVLGVCRYRAPIDVWQHKLGLAPDTLENEAMRWGTLLEPLIASEYTHRTGREVTAAQEFVRHPDHPWMTATLDGIAGDRLLEIKTASAWAREWGDEDTDQIPDNYMVQVHHQMACTGHARADVAVLIGGQRLRVYEVERNDDLIGAMLEREREFWDHVRSRTPPTWGKLDARALAALNARCDGLMEFDADAAGDLEAYEQAAYEILRLEKVKKLAGARVLAAMGEAQFGLLPDGSMVKRFRQEVAESTRTVAAHVRHYFRRIKGDDR